MTTRPRSKPHPSSSSVARDQTPACSGRNTRGGQTSAASRSRASSSWRSSASRSARRRGAPGQRPGRFPAGGGSGPTVGRSRADAASGQTVRDHQINRLPRLAAARQRRVIRPAPAPHPQQCHAPDSTFTEQDGSRSPCACAPGSAKHPTGASRLAHPSNSIPSAGKSRAHPRQATSRSRRPLSVRRLPSAAVPPTFDARELIAPSSAPADAGPLGTDHRPIAGLRRGRTPAAPGDAPHVDLAAVAGNIIAAPP